MALRNAWIREPGGMWQEQARYLICKQLHFVSDVFTMKYHSLAIIDTLWLQVEDSVLFIAVTLQAEAVRHGLTLCPHSRPSQLAPKTPP